MGLCCLIACLTARPVRGQVSWTRPAAEDGGFSATVTWLRPVSVESDPDGNSTSEPAIRLQAPGVAVLASELPSPVKVPTTGRPRIVEPTALPRARFGTPHVLPDFSGRAAVVPVAYVPPLSRRESSDDQGEGGLLLLTPMQLSLPGPHRLFRLDSEAAVLERIRQEARETRVPTFIEFPEPLRGETREQPLAPRRWPLSVERAEACYVYHGRLPFEQINSERYGWSMGVLQPPISTLHFYADVVTLPYHLATQPCFAGDTNAGKCLPGDPVPLLLYPPRCSLSGLIAEAAAVTLVAFVFP
jgi:hypothetical protein